MINMQEFVKEFNEEYNFIYGANKQGKYVAGFDEALEYFDSNRTAEETEILKEFIKHRGDFVSSDREVAAFMFTLDKFI